MITSWNWVGPLRALVGIAAWVGGPRAELSAQGHDVPAIQVLRLPAGTPIRVDGRLDEPFWQQAAVASGFRQREPQVGQPASEDTEVRVAIDGTTLLIGIHALDSKPDQVTARILQRDRVVRISPYEPGLRFQGEDVVAIMLDPFHDRRTAYIFATNPNGAEFDALVSNDGREINADWRGVYRVAASRVEDGWSAEFAIPLRSIRYPTDSAALWGFNATRYQARNNEETVWTSWGREPEGFHRVSLAGHLRGLGDLPRGGIKLEAKPYLLTGGTRTYDQGLLASHGRLDAGVDFKWEPTPGLLLDLTANTDFAQAEVDDEQINLTRFDLFYPEKRDFFLENAGIFEFGFRSAFEPPPFLMLFTRRIGVNDSGAVPLLGGLRLTGRAGRQSIGLLNVVTESRFGEPRTNNAVARIKRDLSTGGYIGAMLTDRRSTEGWNATGGVDFLLRPAPALSLQGYAAATGANDSHGGFTARLDAEYTTDRFGGQLAQLYVDRDTRADLGFVTRTDIQRSDANIRVSFRPKALGLRRTDLLMFGQRVASTAGQVQDWLLSPNLSAEWSSGERLFGWYGWGSNHLTDGFLLSDRIQVDSGRYDAWQVGLYANTSARRPVVARLEGLFQGVYGGTVHSIGGEVSLAPTPNVALAVKLTRNLAHLPNGRFSADLTAVRLTLAASTRLVANALIQYNALDNRIGGNFRINYSFRPGSDLFLVFNEQRGDSTRLWAPRDRAALIKLTYLSRF